MKKNKTPTPLPPLTLPPPAPPLNWSKNPLRPFKTLLAFADGVIDGEEGHRVDRFMEQLYAIRWAALCDMYQILDEVLRDQPDQADFRRVLRTAFAKVYGRLPSTDPEPEDGR